MASRRSGALSWTPSAVRSQRRLRSICQARPGADADGRPPDHLDLSVSAGRRSLARGSRSGHGLCGSGKPSWEPPGRPRCCATRAGDAVKTFGQTGREARGIARSASIRGVRGTSARSSRRGSRARRNRTRAGGRRPGKSGDRPGPGLQLGVGGRSASPRPLAAARAPSAAGGCASGLGTQPPDSWRRWPSLPDRPRHDPVEGRTACPGFQSRAARSLESHPFGSMRRPSFWRMTRAGCDCSPCRQKPVPRLVVESEKLLDKGIVADPAATAGAVVVVTADQRVRASPCAT